MKSTLHNCVYSLITVLKFSPKYMFLASATISETWCPQIQASSFTQH